MRLTENDLWTFCFLWAVLALFSAAGARALLGQPPKWQATLHCCLFGLIAGTVYLYWRQDSGLDSYAETLEALTQGTVVTLVASAGSGLLACLVKDTPDEMSTDEELDALDSDLPPRLRRMLRGEE